MLGYGYQGYKGDKQVLGECEQVTYILSVCFKASQFHI